MDTPAQSYRPAGRPPLKVLTSLRFFPAAWVVLFHVQVTGLLAGGPAWYRSFAGIGYAGVNCFFVLSGFILVYTYAGTAMQRPQFWRARVARVYPAYLFSLLVAAPGFFLAVRLKVPFFAWSEQHLTAACLLALSLLQAWVPQGALTWNPVCWSLSAEAFFYLVFPWVLAAGRPLRTGGLLWALAACALLSLLQAVLYLALAPDGADLVDSARDDLLWKNILSFNPALRAPEFVTGALAGYLFIEGKVSARFANPLVAAGLGILATLVLLAGWLPRPLISAGFLSPAFAALIFGLALRPGWVRWLEGRWLLRLGEASYSLYLLHSVVIPLTFNALPGWSPGVRLASALGAALLTALLCFGFVEEPARRLLRPRQRRLVVNP